MRKLFLTGATGYIGRSLLKRLVDEQIVSITCLVHRNAPKWLEGLGGKIRIIRGDVTLPQEYSTVIRECDLVIHMAAATGNAIDAELHRVNVLGTEALLRCCAENGAPAFLFVSSISAAYRRLDDYPYGKSKLDGENLVRASGLPYMIVRPTIVLGRRAPNWPMLRKIATLPVIPLIGGGSKPIQPIALDDVARGIALMVRDFRPGNTVELGGPEILTFRDFLGEIRIACGVGRPVGQLRIGVRLLQLPIRLGAIVFGERMPVSAGQLVPFVEDGTASPNYVQAELASEMSPLAKLLAVIETQGAEDSEDRECTALTRYLVGRDPDDYVMRKYRDGQAQVARRAAPSVMDDTLLKMAHGSAWKVQIADTYARFFLPYCLLRQKLVYLLAVLENSPTFHRELTCGLPADSLLSGSLSIARASAGSALALIAGLLMLGPKHLFRTRSRDDNA